MNRWVTYLGGALVSSLAGYLLYSAARDLSDDGGAANVFAALGMIGLVVMLAGNVVPRYMGRLRRSLTYAGTAILASFLGWSLYANLQNLSEDANAANVFLSLGTFGILLLLAGATLQRARR